MQEAVETIFLGVGSGRIVMQRVIEEPLKRPDS